MTAENKSVNQEVLEEMNRSCKEIEATDCNSPKTLNSEFWKLSLIYGRLKGKKHFTYAVKVVSKTGEHEEDFFPYSAFIGKDGEPFRKDMDDWCSCDDKEFIKLQEYAKYLKLADIFTKSDMLDDLLGGCEEKTDSSTDIEEYEEKIRDYIANNYESIALKSKNEFNSNEYEGAWLDTPRLMKKYGGKVVLALQNTKVDEILGITDTKKLGQVKSLMTKDDFLIYKEPQDVTLSPHNEKKCSLFRISPDEQ